MGYRIVIDVSVARAAAPSRDCGASVCCRTLESLTTGGHKLVLSRDIRAEWLREEQDRPASSWRIYVSRYAYQWLTDMTQRRLVVYVPSGQMESLRTALLTATEPNKRPALNKDFPLVEAALATDRRVVSMDRRIHRILRGAAGIVPDIRSILWLHPVDHDAPSWLRAGAEDDCRLRVYAQ